MSPARLPAPPPAPPRPGSRRRLGSSSPRLATFVCAFVATAALAPPPALAFKAADFKTCATSSFCARHRDAPDGATSPVYAVSDAFALSRDGSEATATLLANGDATRPLTLTLTSFGDEGVVRARVDDPKHPRYRVPDVLVDDLDRRRSKFTAATPVLAEDDPRATRATLFSVPDPDVVVEVRHAPLRVTLLRGGVETIVFNARGLFAFERLGDAAAEASASVDGDPDAAAPSPASFRETFNGHEDTRPNGPTAVAFDVAFPRAGHVYGIPERATSLSLRPTLEGGEDGTARVVLSEPYRMYNLDVFEYEHDSPFGLYGSIPVMLAHAGDEHSSVTSGVYYHNPTETYVDVLRRGDGAHTRWMSESGAVDIFLLPGPTPAATTRQYTALTGTTRMPPAFSLGYHQCRWNYRDEADVASVDAGFDEHDVPYDVLWLDIEHTDGKRYMTWDASAFPTPERMIEDVASRGRKMVAIVDPHVKKDPKYPIHREAESRGYYVKNPDGSDFDGWCWPGSSAYLDVVSPVVRDWWSRKFALDAYPGSTRDLYVWNDMNEPSVFNGPEVTMRKDLVHHGGVEHREVHNAFGMYYHAATAEGVARRNGERPFVLSRAFFAGTQRVGPIWTGDNAADWDHLRVSVPMTLTLGLTGLTWSGADVGGFFGNPDAELMTRWYQLGIYYPFFRGHAHLDTKRREPWTFGGEHTARIRDAIRRRYQLMPYLYTLFEAANREGSPVARPLWYEFPDDPSAYAREDALMLGPAILVHPVLHPGAETVRVSLPAGLWYDFDTGDVVGGPATFDRHVTADDCPTYVRGGFVIVRRDRARRSVAAMRGDPFVVVVAPDERGEARGEVYLDDGASLDAATRRDFVRRSIRFEPTSDGSGYVVRGEAPSAASARAGGTDGTRGAAPTGAPGAFAGHPDTHAAVEKIIVLGGKRLGLADAGASATAGGRTLKMRPSAGSTRAGAAESSAAVRKPDVVLASDWVVEIKR